ncbi:MAG TPA: DegQ family serine endoprotease [Candidatus Aminicenantes bacterium]|nr:DegQ family serine endoprotease [Candidatus Aminicenantes bacterium]
MKKFFWIAGISFLLGLITAGMIFFYFPEKNSSATNHPPSSDLAGHLFASPSPQLTNNNGFVEIANKVGPAVVQIKADKVEKRTVSTWGEEWPFDDWWERFFGVPREREQEFRATSFGSGFFISPDGYILTNNHVVENAETVNVYTISKDEYKAKIVGTDPKTDLALLKVEASNLPYAQLGDSSQCQVGEWVIAIGNPLGMEHTVTAGIISAKGRQLRGSLNLPEYQDFIQTDTAINRGNSGGPLVNMRGEVIGVTSIILAPTGGNIGIGFAIPSNLAKKIIEQLKKNGRVIRGFLGVIVSDVTEDVKKLLKLETKEGALVHNVQPGTPAEEAGLKVYDVILAIDGKPVKDSNDLKFKIAEIPPGKEIELKIFRDGEVKKLKAKIAELEPEEEAQPQATADKDIGITVQELTPQLARRYGFQTEEGLLITKVKRYSVAAEAGLQRGDIILEVNRKTVRKIRDLEKILRNLKSGDPVMLRIRRETRDGFSDYIITLRLP